METIKTALNEAADQYPELMSVDQVAKLTGLSKKTVQNHISLGNLPVVRPLGVPRVVKQLFLAQCLKRGQNGKVRVRQENQRA
jgi:excisionase family DNA binding protein